MKKDLNIMEQGGFDLVELPEQESEPMVSVSMSHLRELTPLSEKAGRVGYFQTAKEEKKEPVFTIGKYEDIKKVWANHSDNIVTLGENEGRIGLFQEVKDMKKEPIIVSEYESNHKPVRLPC